MPTPPTRDYEAFVAELRGIVKATWLDAAAIWDYERVVRQEWAGLTLPYVATQTSLWSDGFGDIPALTLSVFRGQVALYYVMTVAGDNTPLREKAEAMEAALRMPGAFSTVKFGWLAGSDWSDQTYPNLALVERKSPQRAVCVQFVVHLGA